MKKTYFILLLFFSCLIPTGIAQTDTTHFKRKNILKADPFILVPLMRTQTFEYERFLNENWSFNFRFTNYENSYRTGIDRNILKATISLPFTLIEGTNFYGELITGVRLTPELRHYFFSENGIPHGFYVGAFLNYRHLKSKFEDHFESYGTNHPMDTLNFSHYSVSNEYGGGLSLGINMVSKKGFSLDVFGGLLFSVPVYKRTFKDNRLNENMLEEKFTNYGALYWPGFSTCFRPVAGIRVGLNFSGAELKHKYSDPVLDVQKKNVFKINAGLALGYFSLTYERFLKKRFSAQLSGGYFYKYLSSMSSSVTITDSVLTESSSYKKGIHITPSLRYYFNRPKKSFPGGLVLELVGRFRSFDYVFNDLDTIPKAIKYDYTKKVQQLSIGTSLGYQIAWKNNITMEFYFGGLYDTNFEGSRKFKNPLANESGLELKFKDASTGKKFHRHSITAMGGIRIGYAF